MPEVNHLLWIDLETTGTNEKLDEIVEVGFIVTDKNLVEIASGSRVLQVSERGWRRLEDNPVVYTMHTENKLVEDLRAFDGNLPDAREFEIWLLETLSDLGVESHKVMLAGSGVGHFDRRFIKEHMPLLDTVLAYPVIDIGVIRRFYSELCGMEVSAINDGKTHRALDDIRCHLEEAKWFKNQFSS